MPVHIPAEIASAGLVDSGCNGGEIGGNVMLETILKNKIQQLLHIRNLDTPSAAKGVERIFSKPPPPAVAAHAASRIVGGKTGEAHFLWLDQTDAGTKGVFLSDGASN